MIEAGILSLVTYYSFEFAFAAMLGGVLYFSLERNSLALEYKIVATLAAVVALVAAINYYHMAGLVREAIGEGSLLENFPTSFRYIDWLITTPLLLAMIVSLLGLKEGAGKLISGLVVADVIMIVAGYFGEMNINMEGGSMGMAWGGFILSMFCWLYILFVLYSVLSSYSAQQEPVIQHALNTLRLIVLLSWAIYPIGYFVSLLGAGDELKVAREIIYCFADVFSKVGYGMIAVSAAKKASFVWDTPEEQNQVE